MSYAKKLRVRSYQLSDIYIGLNSTLKDFKKIDEEFYPIAHRLVNIAYEQLCKEARSNIESFNPRWSTVHNIREEVTGKLNAHFNRNLQCTSESIEGISKSSL